METLSFDVSSLLGWLFDSTMYVSIFICLIILIKAVSRGKMPAWWSYGLWLLLVVRMLMPWGVESRMSIFNYVPAPPANEAYMPYLMEKEIYLPLMPDQADTLPLTEAEMSGEVVDRPDHPNNNLSLDMALLLTWFTGIIIFSITILYKNLRFWLIIKQKPVIADSKVLELLRKCRSILEIRWDIAVIETDRIKSPALFGYFRPKLLLPQNFLNTLEKNELRLVFLHELGHLKRHDIAISWLVTLLQGIHWFNPFVWYAFHTMRVDQEVACDAWVLSRIKKVQPADYANTIVDLLERFIQNRQLPSLAGIIENKSQMKRRIAMIMNFKRYSLKTTCASILMLFVVGLIFFTSSSGKADVKKPETAGDLKEAQYIRQGDEKVSNSYDNKVSQSKNEIELDREADIVVPKRVVKKIGMKEEADINLVRVETKNVKTQIDPLILAANKKQEILSENKIPEIEEPESEPGIEHSEAVQQRQDSFLDYTSRGLFNLHKEQIEEAISDFNKAIELNPGNSAAYYSRGMTYYMHGKIDNAISDFNKAIEIIPEFTDAYKSRGYVYYSIDNYEKAMSDYNRAIEINPEDTAAYNMRGIAYYMHGKIDNAISDFNKAIEINPEDPAAYQNRGYLYHSKRKFKKAISDYNKAIELNPENAVAKKYRSIARRSRMSYQSYYATGAFGTGTGTPGAEYSYESYIGSLLQSYGKVAE